MGIDLHKPDSRATFSLKDKSESTWSISISNILCGNYGGEHEGVGGGRLIRTTRMSRASRWEIQLYKVF